MTQIDERKLRDIVQLKSGNTPSKADSSLWGGHINWVSASSMHSDVIYDSEMKLTEEGLKYSKTFPRNTIVILIRGSMLWNRIPICRLGEKAAINQDVKSIVVTSEGLDTDYLYFWLKAKEPKLKQAVIGTGIGAGKIETEFLYNLPIRIPNRTHQKRLINLFKAVDQKINLLTKKKVALETYKKGLMQKIFSQELRFKREDGTNYPEWEENEIGQIFKEVRDKVGDSVVETFSITAGKGFVSQAEKFGRDISGSQNPNYIRLKPNQYSYNKGNSKTFKYGCVYRNLIGKDIAVPNVFISLDLLNGDYRYFDALFESHLLDRHLRRIISSSARMDGLLNIPKRDFFLISLPVPCLEEQAKIGQSMQQLNETIGVIERQLQNVISLKKGLLQQMFV